MFDAVRHVVGSALVAAFYAVAPSTVPEWRLNPAVPPALVLAVGDPVSWLPARFGEPWPTRQ